MRQCPFTNCGRTVPDEKFACFPHWVMLNKAQQQRVYACYGDYQAGKIGLEELRAAQQAVMDEYYGKAPPEVKPTAVPGTRPGVCRSCQAPILWALTVNNKDIPLDVEPREKGNIVLTPNGSRVIPKADLDSAEYEGVNRYVSHFGTCPNAQQHRR